MTNTEGNIKLNECKLKEVPIYLPKELKEWIQKIIEAFKYAETDPYYSYFTKTSKFKYPPLEKMDENRWNEYKKTLNRYNNTFNLISDGKMKDVWLSLYGESDGNYNFFTFISVRYNDLIGFQVRDIISISKLGSDDNSRRLFGLLKKLVKKEKSKKLSNELEILLKNKTPLDNKDNLEDFKHNLQCIESQLDTNWTLFAPDGADCFENMDKNDPENKMYLDKNGDFPYKINWDLYIRDEEMKVFRDILSKLIIKSENKINLYNDDKSKIKEYLSNPISRKKDVDGSCEIQLAKILYIRFMMELKKPLYAEIAIILEILFGSPYTYNDIVKFTKKPRDNIKKLKEKIKKEGAEHYFNDSFDEKSLMD